MRRALALSVLLTACGSADRAGPARAPEGEKNQVVARIDDQVITVGDLEARMGGLDPFSRARFSSPEQKKKYLEELVRFEVMAKEARSRGYDQDPDVQRVMKSHLIRVMLAREVDDKLKPDDLPEADVQRFYDVNIDKFRRPEQVRVSQIFTTDRTRADKAVAAARAASGDKAFRELVDRLSEDEDSKIRGGDLTFFDAKSTMYPRALIDAAFALKEVGDVSAPVQSDKGYHVLKLTQRRPGFTRPLDEVKNDVRRMMLGEMRQKRIDALVNEMRQKLKVEIYENELAKVTANVDAGRTP